jgi:hypothetical protein
MPASAKARISRDCAPSDVDISGIIRDDQKRNPRKSVDSLIRYSHSRRLRIHVVDGCDNIIGTTIVDPDRSRIGDSPGGRQKHQREAGNDDWLMYGTH